MTTYIIQVWWPTAQEWRDDVAPYPADELTQVKECLAMMREIRPHRQFRLARRVTTIADTVIDPAVEDATTPNQHQEALTVALQWLRLFRDYAPVIAPTADPALRKRNQVQLANVLASEELAAAIAMIEGLVNKEEVTE
jgi:hypothetical protein